MAVCEVCFRHCEIEEGGIGYCGGRTCEEGKVRPSNYGMITALALDPIEKKPLRRYMPGSFVLSVGSYGCNLRCPFCQNSDISWSEEALNMAERRCSYISPGELAEMAFDQRSKGNAGVAFTYNEPLIGYEYVRDAAEEVHRVGMKNILVTNGTAGSAIVDELEGLIDAMNIDLKGFSDIYYERVLGGDRKMVMDFISRAVTFCHVELTCLIVPGENDSVDEMREMSRWIAGLEDNRGNVIGSRIPLHISRFFPRFHMRDRDATEVAQIRRLVETARERLEFVYPGNC